MITASGDEFNLAASSIPAPTWDYLTNLAWITAAENVALVGPAGTGKSHTLIACGVAAVHAGHKIKYYIAADLVETLYRGLADNSVGRVIDTILRNEMIRTRSNIRRSATPTGSSKPVCGPRSGPSATPTTTPSPRP